MAPFVRGHAVRHADRVLARSVFCLALAVYAATFVGIPEVPEGELAFQSARSLARELDLAIGATPEAQVFVEFARSHGTGGALAAGRDGERLYSVHGVGLSLVALPLYWAGWAAGELAWTEIQRRHEDVGLYGRSVSEYFQHLFVGFQNPLLGACTAWLVVLVARRLGLERRQAWLAGIAYALTTFAWPQARSCLPEVQAAFWLFFAFYWVLRVRERFEQLETPRRGELLALGAGVGLAFLTRASLAPACLVLCIAGEVVVWSGHKRLSASRWTPRDRQQRGVRAALALLFLPIVLALLVFAITNWLRFGSALDTGAPPGGFLAKDFGTSARLGLLGLLASPGRGLFWMAPGLLVIPFGFAQAREIGERLWRRVTLGVALAVVVPLVFQREWHGSWTYGPRYLLPALPFLWLAVALALPAAAESRGLRLFLAAALTLGLLVQLPAALVDHVTHQDLAMQAAEIAWPSGGGDPDEEAADRFQRIQWTWGFAAPWAHWRILRHRLAGLDESYPVNEVFRVDDDATVRPLFAREEGFRHLAWVDLIERLSGPVWPGVLLFLALATVGALLTAQGLDRSAP